MPWRILFQQKDSDWVIQLDEMMQEKSCFIAVGAAHLAGEEGMIKLLRENGYKVDPICLIQDCQ